MNGSAFLKDFRETAAKPPAAASCWSGPTWCARLVEKHQARDTTQRGTAMAELEALQPRSSQHNPGNEIPEEHWMYRFAKKHWFFGFGAYS